ncbi:hypothetical protein CDD82_6658 [Ophiocordyceps australis]|uniref:F-box domain-containing protein n=1 Tax=Ophiocordyceps australis TaxID=1399860 RepID=A0A2C5Y2X5_9HYPO|nr:hypothetical protein CDD82_6658 [Ophiocordyceps australis]
MAAEACGRQTAAPRPPARSRLTFMDLPAETQREIIAHCSGIDLICVALVSKHFHELASTQLYRSVHIVFPDDDDANFDSPIDGLAGGLDTFTTSSYNYAKHLRDLSMDTLSVGDAGEQAYQPYLYSASCGKFFNTLLHLTLKKAISLETFKWNIRVELTRPVYSQLHRILSLKKLHVRLQAGASYYSPPPPLPSSSDSHSQTLPVGHSAVLPSSSPASAALAATTHPGSGHPSPKSPLKSAPYNRPSPATFSGFQNLKSLAVLDIDSVDVVPEVKTCIKNSFSSLKELSLSLSDQLAQKARKPLPESDGEDSDVEEDFQIISASQQPSDYDSTGPAKAFRAQEERKAQEAILGKILNVESKLSKKPKLRSKKSRDAFISAAVSEKQAAENAEVTGDPREDFITAIRDATTKLMALQNGSRDFSAPQQDVLDTIEKAARKYVAFSHAPNTDEGVETHNLGQPALFSGGTSDSQLDLDQATEERTNSTAAETTVANRNGEQEQVREEPSITNEETDEVMVDYDEQLLTAATSVTENNETDATSSSPTTLNGGQHCQGRLAEAMTQVFRLQLLVEQAKLVPLSDKLCDLRDQFVLLTENLRLMRSEGTVTSSSELHHIESELRHLYKSLGSMFDDVQAVDDEVAALSKKVPGILSKEGRKRDKLRQRMDDYARDTRGLSLESLSIHLMVVKASVLSRGIDVTCLKQLTLLNVGNQIPIWNMLAKESKLRPLALRSIFTDHVTTPFLTCVGQLPLLHELFLLARSEKHKPESFAPLASVDIDQIRRLVLKRHMPTLKRLMIKNDSYLPTWDVNEKTMVYICTRGVQLEELAISMNIYSVHAFMQYFPGLVKLRALNIIRFRNSDTCIWVMREILRFIVDSLSHHSELKLEWIAMEDDRVDRVVRPSSHGESERFGAVSRSRAYQVGHEAGSGGEALGSTAAADWADTDSEGEEPVVDVGKWLRFKTFGPLHFYDVWGVKIFEKEIRSGRL